MAEPIIIPVSDYEQVTVRIYKTDHRTLVWRQANAVQDGKRKPSFADLIHQAVKMLAESK